MARFKTVYLVSEYLLDNNFHSYLDPRVNITKLQKLCSWEFNFIMFSVFSLL